MDDASTSQQNSTHNFERMNNQFMYDIFCLELETTDVSPPARS